MACRKRIRLGLDPIPYHFANRSFITTIIHLLLFLIIGYGSLLMKRKWFIGEYCWVCGSFLNPFKKWCLDPSSAPPNNSLLTKITPMMMDTSWLRGRWFNEMISGFWVSPYYIWTKLWIYTLLSLTKSKKRQKKMIYNPTWSILCLLLRQSITRSLVPSFASPTTVDPPPPTIHCPHHRAISTITINFSR